MGKRWRSQAGVSLVEVVAAVAIIAVALTPMIGLFATSRRSVEGAGNRAEAAALARTVMDQQLARAFATISDAGPVTVGEYTYTVAVTYRAGNLHLKDIWVTVTWVEKGQNLEVEVYSAVADRGEAGG